MERDEDECKGLGLWPAQNAGWGLGGMGQCIQVLRNSESSGSHIWVTS